MYLSRSREKYRKVVTLTHRDTLTGTNFTTWIWQDMTQHIKVSRVHIVNTCGLLSL